MNNVDITEVIPPLETQVVIECYHGEEMGDGGLFARLYRNRVVYDHSARQWYIWNGHYWERDQRGIVPLLFSAQTGAQYLYIAAELRKKATEKDDSEAAKLANAMIKRAGKVRYKNRRNNALDYAASIPYIGVTADIWDATPGTLPVKNGVVDMGTGVLDEGNPTHFIRTVAPVDWLGPLKPAPRWEQFVNEITGHNEGVAQFMQRLLGYAASGNVTEHIFPIFWGEDGRNGKDTLFEVLGYVLGPLAGGVSKDVILHKRGSSPGAATPHLMALQGKRIVWAAETDEGARLDMGAVKLVTGGGRLRGRPLYGQEVEWDPTHTAFLITNPKPHLNADDNALWARVIVLPFEQRFVPDPNPLNPNEHKADPHLKRTLREEASGILAWLVRGYQEYLKHGLNQPQEVVEARETYRAEEDTLGIFLDEYCQVAESDEVRASLLYAAYLSWCRANSINGMSGISFGKKLKKRFPTRRGSMGVVYLGLSILPEHEKSLILFN